MTAAEGRQSLEALRAHVADTPMVGDYAALGTVLDELTEALRGADAVIHLAWLIQPNSHRDLLRRVNVDGTAHVGRAAAEAGRRGISPRRAGRPCP